MTFIERLEKIIYSNYGLNDDGSLDFELENILEIFKTYGNYLNAIPHNEIILIEDLAELLNDYCTQIEKYTAFKNGETDMLYSKKNRNTTPSKIRIQQDINLLKKTRSLLSMVSSEDYRIMQGSEDFFDFPETAPIPPMSWQKNKNGKKKYKDIDNYCFTNYQDKEVALKAYNQTISLYSDKGKYPFDMHYRVEKDIFNTYYFLSSLIEDLEEKRFYLFEKTQYYPVEKPSKTKIKFYLKELRKHYKLKNSLEEKELIDNF